MESISPRGACHKACSRLGNSVSTPLKAELLTSREIFIVFVSVLEERILHKILVKREAILVLPCKGFSFYFFFVSFLLSCLLFIFNVDFAEHVSAATDLLFSCVIEL